MLAWPVHPWSGGLDSNQRPLDPQSSALPNCATTRCLLTFSMRRYSIYHSSLPWASDFLLPCPIHQARCTDGYGSFEVPLFRWGLSDWPTSQRGLLKEVVVDQGVAIGQRKRRSRPLRDLRDRWAPRPLLRSSWIPLAEKRGRLWGKQGCGIVLISAWARLGTSKSCRRHECHRHHTRRGAAPTMGGVQQ